MSFPNSASVRPRSLRGALLGAVAIVAVGGVALETAPAVRQCRGRRDQRRARRPRLLRRCRRSREGRRRLGQGQDFRGRQRRPVRMRRICPNSRPAARWTASSSSSVRDRTATATCPACSRIIPHLQMAQGSGFFISADGYIVTNNHVVDHATDVTVTTVDGKTIAAKVIGTDSKTDLALLKVKEGGNYPFVNFASQSPRVGDWVIAVGNPFGLGGTVTAGIVSARGRDIGSGPYDDFLQIDAPVNRGNSGGPTFNTEGEVVGVNTAIFSPSGGSVGIGFAIASDVVKSVVQSLKDHGSVARGWLGVEIQPVSADIADSLGIKEASGALVSKAQADSPAAGGRRQDRRRHHLGQWRERRRSQGTGAQDRAARPQDDRRARHHPQRRRRRRSA